MYQILLPNPANPSPLVISDCGVDDDLTDGVTDALGRAESTRAKVRHLLERTLNCLAEHTPDGTLDLHEAMEAAILRFRRHLTNDLGCVVKPASGLRDGSFDVQCRSGRETEVSLVIARMRVVYGTVLGPDRQNPLAVDGWHLAANERLVERLGRPRNGRDAFRTETGNRFRVVDRPWCPPPLDDVRGVTRRLVEGARRHDWPPVPMSLLLAMRDDAPRSGDLLATNARDWWRSSKFGRSFAAPVKGSRGERRRVVAISHETREKMLEGFAQRHLDDPTIPDMDALQAMADRHDYAGLALVPLFGGRSGPMTHSGFYKPYFRPLVVTEGIMIDGPEEQRFARPHDVRHEQIGEMVGDVLAAHPEEGPDRKAALEELNDRLGWLSYMIPHYSAPRLLEEATRRRLAAMDARSSQPHDQAAAWSARSRPSKSALVEAWPE